MLLRKRKSRRVKEIPIVQIRPCRTQPRKNYASEEMNELAMSIRKNGVIQPITVRKVTKIEYELIAGERRLRACVMCGQKKIPCIVISCTDDQAELFSLEENIQRADLNIYEIAQGITRLMNSQKLTETEAADKLCKELSALKDKMAILQLDDTERQLILKAHLTERHIKALLKITDKQERRMILSEIIEYNLNVSQSEGYIRSCLEKTALEKLQAQRRRGVIKDIRLFENTIQKAVTALTSTGIDADRMTYYNNDYIEYVIRVPKDKKAADNDSAAA